MQTDHTINNITRKNNYIGKSNWNTDSNFKGKIYYFNIKKNNINL